MTCCDLIHGQHTGPEQVINEEVIRPGFDDDKLKYGYGNIEMNGGYIPQTHYPPIIEHQFEGDFPHKIQCHHPFGGSHQSFGAPYPQFHWPQHVYKRPVYRPKIFYKPLLFG